MMFMIFRLLRAPFAATLVVWGAIAGVVSVLRYFGFMDAMGGFAIWGYFWSFFVSQAAVQYPRAISLFRLTSRSIASLWGWLLMIHLILSVFNFLIYALALALMREDLSEIPIFDLLWVNLIFPIFFYGIVRLSPDRAMKWSYRKSLWMSAQLFAYWIGAPVFIFLYFMSPSLGYAVLALIFLLLGLFNGDLSRASFYQITRLKLATVGIFLLILVWVLSAFLVSIQNPRADRLFSLLFDPRQEWRVSDVEQLKSVDEWINWYEDVSRDLTAKDALKAFQQLDKLCPFKPSDVPLEIHCIGSVEDSTYINKKWKWPVEDAMVLLRSNSEYAWIVALLWLREQPAPWPSSVHSLVTSLGGVPGGVSVVAQSTLAGNKTKRGLRLEIVTAPSVERERQ